MSVEQDCPDEGCIETELVGQSKLQVIETINEVDESGRLPEESIARTIIPYYRDDDKARYLGYRACAFTSREAMKLIEKTMSCLSNWRTDPEFVALEQKLPEYRKELANEYCELEFSRNYRLVMEKDHQILKKSLEPDKEVLTDDGSITIPNMSKQENDYLLKMRGYYTPQQLSIMTAIGGGKNGATGDEVFDFTKAVLTIARTSERMELKVGE